MNDREMDLQKAVDDAEEAYLAAELAWSSFDKKIMMFILEVDLI